MSNPFLRFEGAYDPAGAAELVEAVRRGLAAGSLTLTQGEASLELTLAGPVSMQVTAALTGAGGRLGLTFRWKQSPNEAAAAAPLVIGGRAGAEL